MDAIAVDRHSGSHVLIGCFAGPAGSSRRPAGLPSPRRRFWLIAFAFLTAMAFSTVPTPLYPLYMARDGFSTFMVTVVFAVYAVAS